MTFEEAKKILKKEGFYIIKFGGPSDIVNDPFSEYESPEIFEAGKVVNSAGYGVGMHGEVFNERKARLKKEYEKNTKAPGPGVNPALKESASQFNDALLDEQAKKIAELTKEKTNLEDQITILNACKEHNENFGRKQIKRLGKEISKLNSIIHDKNAVLSDVAEELRLTKIREKNLAELGLKYVGENEKLKKELADKVVDEINAKALKSAESALAWKEKVVTYKDMALAYYEKKIAEKDEVIADLGKELKATKTELEEKTKLVETVRKGSKEYCDYGIAAEKMIQKMAKVIVEDRAIDSEDLKNYRHWANGYRFSPLLPEFCDEELMNLQEEALKKCNTSEDNHPTEDNSEEVKMEEILEHVREVLEKGGTVTTSYDKAEEGGDKSATIVQHGNSIAIFFKEIKRLWQE